MLVFTSKTSLFDSSMENHVKSALIPADPVTRLVLGLFAGFPLAVVYRLLLYRKTPAFQHAYFTSSGLYIAYFILGWGCLHSLLNIVLAYLLLKFGGPQARTAFAMLALNMVYLVSGYISKAASGDYTISWTTTHCVLCLRLTGLAWDYHDGNHDQEKLSKDFKTTAIKRFPSFLEVAGYVYCYGGFLVGPQFPMKKYLALVDGNLIKKEDDNLYLCVVAGLKRLLIGSVLLIVYSISKSSVSKAFLLTDEYSKLPFILRLLFVVCCVRIFILKYQAVWLIAENSCIITGLGYNGKTTNGELLWDGCSNSKLLLFETAHTFQHVIGAFNLTTNEWMFRYFFKRLRFLGNKILSHLLTMMFVALWHGLEPGYLLCFVGEFAIIVMEKQLFGLYRHFVGKPFEELPLVFRAAFVALGVCIRLTGVSFCMVGFILKHFNQIHKVWLSLHYIVPVALCSWSIFYLAVIFPLLRARKRDHNDNGPKKAQ